MATLDFCMPSNVVFGNESLLRLPEFSCQNKEKIVIVADRDLIGIGAVDKTKRVLSEYAQNIIVYEISSFASSKEIMEGVDIVKNSRADVVIGLGGENVLGAAKGLAQFGTHEISKEEIKSHMKFGVKKVKYIEIPLLPAINWGIMPQTFLRDSEDNIKKSYYDKESLASAIIIDPTLMEEVPISDIIYYSLTSLAYSFDAFISKKSNPLSDAFSYKALEYLSMNLRKLSVEAANIKIKGNLCMGSLLSSMGIYMSSFGSASACGMALETTKIIPNYMASAILLPHIMEFNLTAAANKFIQIAMALGEKVTDISVIEAAIAGIESIRRIMLDLHIPQRLSEYKVTQDAIEKAANAGGSFDFLTYNPRNAGRNELSEIMSSAY